MRPAVAEDRRKLFGEYQQGGRFGQRLVLAAEVTLQFLDPAPLLLGFRDTVITGFAQATDRVLLPAIQIARIQAVLTAPGTAGGFVHRGGGDHRFEPCRRAPLPRVSAPIVGGQGGGTPALQGGDADADLL
jgi:hypothetical protein